jgi:hypothetical protein
MSKLKLAELYKQNIKELLLADKPTALYLLAMLKEIEENERLLNKLTVEKYTSSYPEFDVSTWGEMMRKEGVSVWRLKPKGLTETNARQYRIIYTYNGKDDTYHLLGVMNRSVDYETSTPFAKQVIEQYDNLGFRRYIIH